MMKRLLALFKKKPDKQHKFADVVKEFIDKTTTEQNLTEGTINKYQCLYNNISLFLHTNKMQDCYLTDVKVRTMEDLRFWLHKNLKTCTVSHASRHIEFCKRVMKYAVLMEYITHSPIEPMETKRDPDKEVVHLEAHELTRMLTTIFKNDIYNIVADLYLFQCFTGLSYGDLWNYEIIEDGKYTFITDKRTKTGKTYCAEYTSMARSINDKYSGSLPRITNQSYNRILKELALILNINKHLTTHTARKTFATIKNNEGYSLETIADMMGNTPQVARKHYIKSSRERLKNEITRLIYKPSLN
jgi:integrase/recombinase XerD